MAQVQLHNIVKEYGAERVIHGVDINIDDGAFVALVGPSGCGKSTLLRMLAGLEKISGGEIFIDERKVNRVSSKDRDIAMVFQNYALYPHMRVFDNMAFSLKLRGDDRTSIDRRVERAARILGLEELLSRYPRQLSGGQKQRVAMGRAIVRDPQVFLFDEPLSNLDAKTRVQMRSEIRALHQRLGTTTIYVTHDQVEAMTMADKIVVMNNGCVEQTGTPLELYDEPRNTFVAGFIGSPSMNMLKGNISLNGTPKFTSAGGLELPLPELRRHRQSGSVFLGIRPEHIEISDRGAEAEVRVVEPTGSETHIVAGAANDDVVVALKERYLASPGDKIRLMVKPNHIHVFDAATGARL